MMMPRKKLWYLPILLAIFGMACSSRPSGGGNLTQRGLVKPASIETSSVHLDRAFDERRNEIRVVARSAGISDPIYSIERTFDALGNKLTETYFSGALHSRVLSTEEWTYFAGTKDIETHQRESKDVVGGSKKCVEEVYQEPGKLLARVSSDSKCSGGLITQAMAKSSLSLR